MNKPFDRRSFLKLAGLAAGAGLVPAGAFRALADTPAYTGTFLVTVHAGGGWDPLFLCDPKDDPTLNRVAAGVGTAGNLRFSDHEVDPVALGYDATHATEYAANMLSNRTFFERHRARTVVLNGVDTRTNNHDTGTRFVWSGHSPVGHPSIGALAAAAAGPGRPIAYLSQGGYDHTAGLVPLARAANAYAMGRLVDPNRIDPTNAESERYHAPGTYARILEAQRARLAADREAASLPRMRGAMERMERARLGTADLGALVLPESLMQLPGYDLYDLQLMMQQTQLAMSAFAAGVSVAASLTIGGFDTHGSHDQLHVRQLAKLLAGVDFIRREAERAGLGHRVLIVVGSDFGRGPTYNGTNQYAGKDHWPSTSMMVLLPDGARGGDRVIGATDDGQRPRGLDPATLAPVDGGARLSPATVHRALRRLLSLEGNADAAQYPLLGDDLALFG